MSVVGAGMLAVAGVVVFAGPAQAATCDGDLHRIVVPGGEVYYQCLPGGMTGDVTDTRPDGKCAYADVWGDHIAYRTYRACGFGNETSWDIDYPSGAVHVRLRTA
jgi:hypothetical protein